MVFGGGTVGIMGKSYPGLGLGFQDVIWHSIKFWNLTFGQGFEAHVIGEFGDHLLEVHDCKRHCGVLGECFYDLISDFVWALTFGGREIAQAKAVNFYVEKGGEGGDGLSSKFQARGISCNEHFGMLQGQYGNSL